MGYHPTYDDDADGASMFGPLVFILIVVIAFGVWFGVRAVRSSAPAEAAPSTLPPVTAPPTPLAAADKSKAREIRFPSLAVDVTIICLGPNGLYSTTKGAVVVPHDPLCTTPTTTTGVPR